MGAQVSDKRVAVGRTGARVAAVGAAMGVALVPAGAAHANIGGVGNAVFGNSCANVGDAQARGATAASPGVLGGNLAQLPLDLPRNQCGNSGIVCLVNIGTGCVIV
ncbi:chaplin family protein [Streptomyces sp. SudanB182_2057]|uniref:chaplin family protein n=1 Tax=Streptomyces sp. SudanB182_2057 TaxID=3035281 RepID=UPI003F54CAC7